jgi:CTP:molybdopterin cytidylyltransferase MocA
VADAAGGRAVSDIAVAVLAAGRGSRLGGDDAKPLVQWAGRPLLAWALDAATASGLRPVLVVSGYRAADVVDALGARGEGNDGVVVVTNDDWDTGIASSLRAALEFLDGRADVRAACVGLADQPRVGALAYQRLADTYVRGADFVAATYGGQRANPVLLARNLWPEARALTGDVGARALMRRHAVVEVPCDDTGSPADVDTIDDLDRLNREAP